MNTHCFRLIFSKPLGCLIPVAELTHARRKPGQQPIKQLAVSLLLAGLPGLALAEIVVDRSTSTHVISAPNGVPVIEIANPNGKGLSHNRFTEFDVQNPGVIFNNSLVNGTSQLGGALLRNPNLSRTARAILSEVTGNKPSSIAGTLEVFGDKADLLIANPNGLTINGVTTLNTSSLTLSSGRVREAASGLQFEVDEQSGQVLIGADGVNTAGLSYFDIVARSVDLQGAVGSQTRETDLQIAAGQGSYDATNRTFTAKPGAEGSGLAISGSAAGAMHGRFINLISSDSGAGVRHDGLIIAARDIRIDGNGDIQLTDTGAGGQAQIAATGAVTNTGALDATTGLAITAKDVVNRKGAYMGSRSDLRIDASNSLTNEQEATVLSAGDMQLRADNRLNNAGTVQAGNRLAITTQELNNSGQGLLRGKTLDVSANTVSNRDGGTLYGSDTVRLDVSGNLTNQSGAGIYAQNALTLNVLGTLLNEAATVAANTLYLNVGSLTNRSAAKVLADAGLSINATGAILNDAATLAGNTVSLKAGSLRNQAGGQVLADTDLTIHANTTLTNAGGTLAAGEKLTLKAGNDLTNHSSGVLAGQTLTLSSNNFYNEDKGQVLGTDIDLVTNHVTSTTGASIQAARNLSVDALTLSVSNSELLAGNNLSLTLGSYQNSGTISSHNIASLTLKNNANLLVDSAFNAPQAANLLTLSANNVTVTGELNAPGSVQINAAGSVRNQGAIIIGKTLGITAQGLIDNQPGKLIWAGEHLILQAGAELLNGFNSQLLAMGDMSLYAGKKLQNDAGRIEAQGNLWIDTPMLENLSRSSGGIGQDGTLGEDTWYGEEYRLLEVGYHHLRFDMPKYQSTIAVTQQGVIKAGESLLLNQDTAKGTQASVRNVGGLMAAGDNMVVDGNLANVGISASHSLVDVLKTATLWGKWSNSGPWPDDDPFGGSAYDILDQVILPANADSRWLSSLKTVKSTELNQLLSAVLGADWKALKLNDLSARWKDFKATNKTQAFYADTQAEISAGKTFVHEGGSFENGDGANWGAQRPITVKVGSQTVQSLDGELNAEFNHGRDKAQQILKEQLENPLFRVRQPGVDDGAFARIKPLYETRTQYLDQSQFFGSEYFLEKIGYDPSKSVTVLGDAYFDHQLIVQSIEQRLGNFFAQTQRLSGTALVSHLLDNGASLTSQSGFVLGQPLTAEQIAALKTDVVWYENQLIDGQLVLAPRLYLSEKTLAARAQDANSSALVSADTVLIDALAVNNVNGTIRGNTDTFIYSKTDINNVSVGGTQAGIFAGQGGEGKTAGQLVIAAEGKVVNQGGIMSGYQQTVVGGEGVSSSATTGYDKNGYLVVRDNGVMGVALSETDPEPQPETTTASAEPAAEKKTYEVARPDVRAIFEERLASGPVDTSQGSSLSVISGGDIDLTGAITQSDNVLLQTSGDVTMDDLHEARSAFDSKHARGFFSSKTVTEMASSANSVGNTLNAKNLTVQAQGDWTITGGEINTDTSNVRVGGDMTVAAGQDLAFHEKTVKSTQLVIGGGAGVGGYEANASWSSALTFDTQLASPFDGLGEEAESLRGHATAGRSAASQALASDGTGNRTGANKGRGGTSGANVKVGLEMVTTVDTTESSTYRNAQLNLGSGSVDVAGTFDFGGADINAGYQLSPQERATLTPEQRVAATNAMPTLDISAGDIKTTKYESTEKTSHSREELFFGMTAEVHSSLADVATQVAQTAHKALGTDAVNDPNAPAGSSKTQAMAEGAMEIDPALTAIAAVGMATQVAFGEVLGASRTFGMQHTEETRDSESRSENINQVGGNISLTSTQGDIALNGVNLQGGKVAIKSAGNLTQQAAKSSTTSTESVTTHRVGLTESIGVAPTGVGMGVSVGADGSYDETTTRATSYTNGLISGTEVSIETAGDHNLIGSNIKGNQVTANIGGNQTITSVQDTSEMTHDRSNWSASVGVAITTNGIIQGTASASASGGRDFDNSKLTAEQAGISADSLDLNVAGNLNLTGAHITSNPGQGSVDVGGKITAQNLHDSREKDGGYAGGGGGISKNGLPSVTLEFGRVDQVNYHADNLATIDVGDPSKVTATQGISSQLNTDADKQLNVTQNKRVAGTDVRIEISIEDAEEIKSGVKSGVKNLLSGKSSSSKYVADAPTARARSNETSKPKTSAGETPKAGYADMPAAKPKPTFEQRVIVNTDTSDPTVNRAVQNLTNKHPENTVVIAPMANGGHEVVQGTLANGGSTKVEVVGHGENGTSLGGLGSKQITELVQNLKADSHLQIDKLNLVGCGTACAKDGNSLVNDVTNLLQQQGATTEVKGYGTAVLVDDQGRKQPTLDDVAFALGKHDQNQLAQGGQVPALPDSIWEAQREGQISHDAAEYLQHVKNKAIDQLKSGPVIFGESHTMPYATLLIKQLINEKAVERVILERSPITQQVAKIDPVQAVIESKGFSSMDDYFSNSSQEEKATQDYQHIRQILTDIFPATTDDIHARRLADVVLKSDVDFDMVDAGRTREKFQSDDLYDFSQRNSVMADYLNSDSKYKQPGVVGVFGEEHLRLGAGPAGYEDPALQQLIGLPEDRVYPIVPTFYDLEINQGYYPWTVLGTRRNQLPLTSEVNPYIVVSDKNELASNQPPAIELAEKPSRVVINAAGESALAAIDSIYGSYPSTTLVFEGSRDGSLSYVAGANLHGDLSTDTFIFTDKSTSHVDPGDWIAAAGRKLAREVNFFEKHEFHLSRDGDFKLGPKPHSAQHLILNTNPGDPAADQAVQRLAQKHPQDTVIINASDQGLALVSGALIPEASTKVEVVGHPVGEGYEQAIGSLNSAELVDVLGMLGEDGLTRPDRLTLVGCGTACSLNGPSLAQMVADRLGDAGFETAVRGYETPIIVDAQGHKESVAVGTPGALGKDDPPQLIWEAERAGEIDYAAAEYLQHVKNKALFQLQTGPVWFGELHGFPHASLLIGQLNAEQKLQRIILEDEPIEKNYELAQQDATRKIMRRKGFASMDDYFSNFTLEEKGTNYFKFAQKELTQEALLMYSDYKAATLSTIINSGARFDFIDNGRLYEGIDNDREEFAVRNLAMAKKINSDPKYMQPGVIGLFGLEHLKTYPGEDGVKEPALQEMTAMPEDRLYPLVSLFDDFETYDGYYPWSALSTKRSSQPAMAETWPYKLQKNQEQLGSDPSEPLYQLRKNINHVVLNAVGEKANTEIQRIRAEHPSTTIVFNALADAGLDYVDGVSASYKPEQHTKAFLFTDARTRPVDTQRWLQQAALKMDRDINFFSTKELYLSEDGTFEVRPTQRSAARAQSDSNEDAL